MSADYDKEQWQSEQIARESAIKQARDKQAKARKRSARNAQKKLERLRRTLIEENEISDFENEFGESVLERLDKYGSAFQDLEKGRPGDALSFAQKRVIAAMNKKVKDLKKMPASSDEPDIDYGRRADRRKAKPTFGFKKNDFKSKSGYRPRVRHIEDDMIETDTPIKEETPFIPEYVPPPKSLI